MKLYYIYVKLKKSIFIIEDNEDKIKFGNLFESRQMAEYALHNWGDYENDRLELEGKEKESDFIEIREIELN